MEPFTQNLSQALAASLQANQTIRKQAEEFISQAQKQPGYVSALLNISAEPSIDPQVCLAAAVQLGTVVEYHWKFRDETHAKKIAVVGFNYVILDEQDKENVRTQIVQKMYQQTNKVVIKQYTRCITTMARFDYPERWPTLLTTDIPNALNSKNEKGIYTGLLALFGLVKKYEYEMDEDREPLNQILSNSFGILGDLINMLIDHTQNEIALSILHLICKVFYVSNQLLLAPSLTQPGALDPWMGFFKKLLDQQLPPELTSFVEDQEEISRRDKTIQWKIKGVASKITYRLFSKYGNPVYAQDNYKKFSKNFQETFSELLLESHLMLMFARKTAFVGSKCLNFVIKYVSSATKIERTMSKLKPFIDNILYETVIPIMLPTMKDITLFSEDPIEYIRKQQDFTETLYMPKNTVIDLLQYIVMYKSNKKDKNAKPDYLIPFLNYAVTNMNNYIQAVQAGQNPDWRIKEALLCSIGHLRNKIDEDGGQITAQMEPLLMTHVLPELKAVQPFLRSRACWMYGEFGDFEFQNQDHIKQAVDGVYQQLFDSELPVRLSAAIALCQLIKNPTAENFLKPALKSILESYLKLMSEIDSEELVKSLETIMTVFSDSMAPYALQIIEQLVQQYQRLIQVDMDEDETGESALAAVGCVTAIRRVLDAVKSEQNLLLQIQPIVLPLMMHGLTPDGLDAIEDAIDCITLLIYYGATGVKIAPTLWKLVPQMLYITAGKEGDVDGGFAFEQLAQVVVAVENFVQKDPETFLSIGEGQEVTYLELTFKFVQNVLVQNQTSKNKLDGIAALKLMICIFENLPGRIDSVMNNLLGMLLAELHTEVNKKKPVSNYLSMLLQTISVAFFNNAELTFQIIQQNNMLVPVFQTWLKFMPEFKLEFEMRRVLFGLACVLRCQNVPQMILNQISEMGKIVAEMCIKQYKDREETLADNEKHLADGFKDSDGPDAEDDMSDGGIEDGDDSEEDFKATKAKLAKYANGEPDESDEDDSDFEFQAGDMQLYDSALDEIDELLFLKETLDGIYQHQPQLYQKIVAAIAPEQMNTFVACLSNAQSLKQREAKCVDAFEQKEKTMGGRNQ